jgi:hypothetical protein
MPAQVVRKAGGSHGGLEVSQREVVVPYRRAGRGTEQLPGVRGFVSAAMRFELLSEEGRQADRAGHRRFTLAVVLAFLSEMGFDEHAVRNAVRALAQQAQSGQSGARWPSRLRTLPQCGAWYMNRDSQATSNAVWYRRLPFAVAGVFVLGLFVSLAEFLRHPATISPVCAFTDGQSYCLMAAGRTGHVPYSRRVVEPLIVRALPGALGAGFRAVEIVGLLVAAALSVLLALRIATRLHVTDAAHRVAIAVTVFAAALITPHALRLAISVPVLVDHGAMASGLIWLTLLTARRRWANVAAIPAAALAVGTREVWAMVIIPVALVALLLDRRQAALAAGSIVAAIATLAVTLSLHSKPGFVDNSISAQVHTALKARFSDANAIWLTALYLVSAVGLIPFVIVLRPPFSWLRREIAQRVDLTAPLLLLAGAIFLVTSPFVGGGNDMPRIAYPATVLVWIFAVPWLIAHRSLWLAGLVLAVGTVLIWQPAHALIAKPLDYGRFYLGRPYAFAYPDARRGMVDLTIAAISVVLAIIAHMLERPRVTQ